MKIESDDEFGELDDVSIQGDTLKISNSDTFTLTRDSDQEIAEGMSFKIADTATSDLRYYPFVERTVGNETTNVTSSTDGNVTVGENVTTPTDNVTTPETPEDLNATTPETTTPEEPTEATNATGEEKEDSPGFGVVLGLVGLLGVVYLVRRNN